MMKKPLALALAATFLSAPALFSPAMAADVINNYQAPPTFNDPAPQGGFTGAYAGVHGGMVSPKLDPFSGSKGLDLGVHGGYNADLGGAVVGGELGYSYLGDADAKAAGGKLSERHRITAKAKVGAPIDQTLVYGTTGLAMTKYRDKGDTQAPDGWKPGFLIGAGVEQNLTSQISARVEYNYVMTGDVRTETAGTAGKKDMHDHTIELGVNYKF